MHDDGTNGKTLHEEAAPADVVSRIKDGIAPVDQWVRTLARERPLVALAGAVGVGYLIGRLLRRL